MIAVTAKPLVSGGTALIESDKFAANCTLRLMTTPCVLLTVVAGSGIGHSVIIMPHYVTGPDGRSHAAMPNLICLIGYQWAVVHPDAWPRISIGNADVTLDPTLPCLIMAWTGFFVRRGRKKSREITRSNRLLRPSRCQRAPSGTSCRLAFPGTPCRRHSTHRGALGAPAAAAARCAKSDKLTP